MTPPELDALRLSLSIALRSVLVSLPFAILFAWLLVRGRWRGKLMLDALVHLPLVLPPVRLRVIAAVRHARADRPVVG